MKIKYYLNLLILLIASCAKQTTPTGGEKDTTPPKLISSNPVDRKTNFTGNEIELVFDELIQVINPREQILITPSIGKKFEVTSKRNKVFFKLNADLQDSTTYTISFRESIQDLTEKNPTVNLKLAFSTTSFIDSLSIHGNVSDLLKAKPVKNFTVAVTAYSDTFNIFKHEAKWITYTDEDGNYTIDNLKNGSYIIYAFNDKNKNLIIDSRNEPFGFKSMALTLNDSSITQDLSVIALDTRDLKLISAKPLSDYYNIRVSKGIASYEITNEDSNQKIYSIVEDGTSIKVFNSFSTLDSLQFRLQVKDSIDNSLDTLLYLKFIEGSSRSEKLKVTLDETKYYTNSSTLITSLSATKPVFSNQYDSIYIRLDSINIIQFSEEDFQWQNNTYARIEKSIPKGTDFTKVPPKPRTANQQGRRQAGAASTEKEKEIIPPKKIPVYNQVILPKATFISIQNDSSAELQLPINTITPENSGTILIEVNSVESIVIEVLEKGVPVKSSTNAKSRFDNLTPGIYQIRVIIDRNKNGKWDPGNYFKNIEPEQVFYYKSEKGEQNVNIKANWELGPLLITPK